jgi:TonB-dependent receptor
MQTDRGSENFEVEYDDGNLGLLELRDYNLTRRRWGFNPALDYRLGNGSELFLRGIFNKFNDDEFRRRIISIVEDGEMERNVRDRYESQIVTSLVAGGRHYLGSSWQMDYRFSFSYAHENEPRAIESVFVQEDVEFDPNVTPDSIDPENIQANPVNEDANSFELNEISSDDNFTRDREVAFGINLSAPLPLGAGPSARLRLGGKYRDRTKDRSNSTLVFESPDALPLTSVQDTRYAPPSTFIDGRYAFRGPFMAPGTARQLIGNGTLDVAADPEAELANFDAAERVGAFYLMSEVNLGSRFQVIPGFRVEHTSMDYGANSVLFDAGGDFVGVSPLRSERNYTHVLPSINARYRLGENTNLRAAFTRSIARPNFVDLVPSELVNEEDEEIERGNPDLRPTNAWNFDLLAEHYFRSVGVFSAGFFYKRLEDNIFLRRFDEDRNGVTFEVSQPFNGDRARLFGLEVALQNQFRFFPSPLDGLGLYNNYTYIDPEANLPGRSGLLPGQVKHTGNLALFYEKYGFSGRVSMNWNGRYIEELTDDPLADVYFDRHFQLDLSASQRLTNHLRLFGEVLNLTNEPLRRYAGFADRPLQREYYKWWATFGIKLDF